MKLYVHDEGKSYILDDVESSLTFLGLVALIRARLNISQEMTLVDANGKALKRTNLIIFDLFEDKDDVYIQRLPVQSRKPLTDITILQPEPINHLEQPRIYLIVQQVRQLLDQRQYRKARLLCEQHPDTEEVMLEVLYTSGRYDACYQRSMELPSGRYYMLQSLAALRKYMEAYAWLDLHRDDLRSDDKRWRILECNMLLGLQRNDDAILLLNTLMEAGRHDLDVVLLYAQCALQSGQLEASVQATLRAVTIAQDNKDVQKHIARVLQHPRGEAALTTAVDSTYSSLDDHSEHPLVSVFAYFATIAKDHSLLETARRLFTKAAALSPANALYALNLLHCLETLDCLEEALETALRFCRNNPQSQTATDFLLAFLDEETSGGKYKVPMEAVCDDDLYLLALGFAMVKVLFLRREYALVRRLVACLETLRQLSTAPLHATAIRNEYAYYLCISQLMSTDCPRFPLISPAEEVAEDPRIYFIGDSHVIPCSGRRIRIHAQNYTIIARLVTGCKVWHLRPDSCFYTRANFLAVCRSLPPRAKVVFMIGEIDCREGLVTAWQRDKYDSLEEAMQAVIALAISVMSSLTEEYSFEVYVHPINPVMRETRDVVQRYNQLYREAVRSVQQLTWLDVLDHRLGDAEWGEAFQLDGTHLHPDFLALLESAFEGI